MDKAATATHDYATIALGALLLWWGFSFWIGPITIGLSAVGTGLILLGLNGARALKGLPVNRSTTAWGIVALIWGTLDHILALSLATSFGLLLIVIGTVTLASLVSRRNAE